MQDPVGAKFWYNMREIKFNRGCDMKLCGSGARPARSLFVFLSAILCVAANAYAVERT